MRVEILSSNPKISYISIVIGIILVMLAWFIFAPSFNSSGSKSKENEINFDVVIDTSLIPDCSVDNPLCRDQIDALSKLEEYIKLQNILIKYQIFNGDFFGEKKKEIQIIKKEADAKFFENYFFEAGQKYDEARKKLENIEDEIEKTKLETESELDSLFSRKMYDQMSLLIAQLKNYSFDEKKISYYLYREENGPKFDKNYSEALTSFRLERYEEALEFIDSALILFPERDEAKTLKDETTNFILELNTKKAVAEIKSMLFESDLTIVDLQQVSKKVDSLKKFNSKYATDEFYDEINERIDNLTFKKYINDALDAFEGEKFETAISSFGSANSIRGLDDESKNKLQIAKDIIKLLGELNRIINGNFDLKKQSNLDILKNKISESKKISSYSSNLHKITKNAEQLYDERNKFIKIKLLSNELFFVDIGTLKLGNFEEKQLELRPGDYDILIKRKGKANSRIKLNISDKSQNRVFKIVCSESVCKINRTSR